MTNLGINNNLKVIDVMCAHQLIIGCKLSLNTNHTIDAM